MEARHLFLNLLNLNFLAFCAVITVLFYFFIIMSNKMLTNRPVKMWIDGKIFNIKCLQKNKNRSRKKLEESPEDPIENHNHIKLLNIEERDGRYQTSFRLPTPYYIKIKHLPDFNIDRVSEETRARIILPKLGFEDKLTVHAEDTKSLVKAVSHIHSAVSEIRQRNIALQFLCIPCLSESIKIRFENLKNEILNIKEIDGLHDSIFISPLKLHITIDIFVLLDESEKNQAIQALHNYRSNLEQILKNTGPLKLDITGLDCMNRNIKKVDVLYANVKLRNETEEHNLQKIANDLAEHFYHRGLLKQYQESVKLHMTIINTKYRKDTGSPKRKRRWRQSIDATKVFEKYRDYSFGECDFDSLHLSHISLKGDDGFYKPLAVLKFSENNRNIE